MPSDYKEMVLPLPLMYWQERLSRTRCPEHKAQIARALQAVQDAFVQALRTSPTRGVPTNPAAWITLTARNKAIDRLRRERVGAVKAAQAEELRALEGLGDDVQQIPDERLRLIFTCCHPALPMEARVALTLRTVGGLSSREIARAFLLTEPTVQQRLVRANP